MAKKITFRFTGEAERILKYMEEQGLNAQDVVARALWLFETAWKTRRVALVDDKFQIEYIYTAQPLTDTDERSIKLHEEEVAMSVDDKGGVARAEVGGISDTLKKVRLNLEELVEQKEFKEKQKDASSAERKSERGSNE